MTRKDYVAIARAFKLAHIPNASAETQASLFELARRLANILALDNPRFDRARFLVSCDVSPQRLRTAATYLERFLKAYGVAR